MVADASGQLLSNRLLFHYRRALEENVGRAATEAVWRNAWAASGENRRAVPDDLQKAVPFQRFAALCMSLEREYGPPGAVIILERCGRSSFSAVLRSTAAMVGLDAPQFRMPSGNGRIAEGLAEVGRLLALLSDMRGGVEAAGSEYRFRLTACPECAGRSGSVLCHSVAGMLRGALDWFGIDPAAPVRELECTAAGSSGCVFSVPGESRGFPDAG